ncbi:MAG: RAD52 family DNA repair protein [Myxococcales bacterium]|nr:RAD52 family DNA repair protein [Myxococcales bacterium]
MKKDLLTRPFRAEQIKQRKGHHGQMLSYVDVAAVIERLNETFDHEWSFEVLQHELQQGEVIVLGKLTAGGVVKTAFGGSGITTDKVGDVLSVADDLKAAASDSLKKCASMLGVALELYGGSKDRQPEQSQAIPPAPRPRPLLPQERVTSRQLAALHSAARRTGLEKRDLEVFLEERVGHSVLNELSRADASRLISELSGNGGDHRA